MSNGENQVAMGDGNVVGSVPSAGIAAPKKHSIKELKELILFGLELKKAMGDIMADGFDIRKLSLVLPLYPSAIAAFGDLDELPKELNDIDESEIEEILALVMKHGVIQDKSKAAEVAQKAIKVAFASFHLFKAIKE